MIAAKFFDDVFYSNSFYASVGGIRTKEINLLELQFLTLLDYNLYVTPREYDQYLRNVLAAVNAGISKSNSFITTSSTVDAAAGAGVSKNNFFYIDVINSMQVLMLPL